MAQQTTKIAVPQDSPGWFQDAMRELNKRLDHLQEQVDRLAAQLTAMP